VGLALGQRQRRQKLDHVVLARRHRDDAVVAMKGDHDQLREQTFARHVDQAPVQSAHPRAWRAQLDSEHEPVASHLFDHLVARRELRETVEQ
jgi:hypothetical protein